MVKIDIKGMPELRKRLEAAGASLAPSAENAITYDIALTTMDEAQKTVPVVSGALRASAFIRKPQGGNNPLVTMGYEMPYALYVHEIPYDGHTTKGLPGAQNNGKGYKWLQKAYVRTMRGAAAKAKERVKKDIKNAWDNAQRTQRKGTAPQPKGGKGGGGGSGILFKLFKVLIGAGGK
jgi:hypothetical protein